MTLTFLLLYCSSGSRSCPDISFAPFFLLLEQAIGLSRNSSYSLSPLFRPNERPCSFNLQKACWDKFALHIDLLLKNSSLSSATALFISLAVNMAKSFIPFSHIRRQPLAWWCFEVKEEGKVARLLFTLTKVKKTDRLAPQLLSMHRLSSRTRKRQRHYPRNVGLSTKSDPKSASYFYHSVASSASSSSSSPSFSNCSSPRESASV